MATILSSRMIRHDICMDELERFGANVVDINGVMTFVKFNLEVVEVSFIYHLNKDDSFFLERISPYSMEVGTFDSEEAIVDLIKVDIKQFKNAMKSKLFIEFVQIDSHISQLVRIFEDLYLYYNIKKEDLDCIHDEVYDVLQKIKDVKKRSERVYFEKEPEVLKDSIDFKNPS